MPSRQPHILLAAPNVKKMLSNVQHLLSKKSVKALEREINNNVSQLYRLGYDHFQFAVGLRQDFWRQKISRYYYGAYNVRRALVLAYRGGYSQDSSDHQKVGDLPDDFPNKDSYSITLKTLRDDRNISDYSHDAEEADLVINVRDAEQFVADFIHDAALYLRARGVSV